MHNQEFKLQVSKHFLFASISFLCMTMCACFITQTFLVVKIICLFFLILFGYQLIQRVLLLNTKAVILLKRERSGWMLQTKNGTYSATLCGDSTVTNYLSVLRFRIPKNNRIIACVVFRDSLPKDIYQILIMAVRANDQRVGVSRVHQLQQK